MSLPEFSIRQVVLVNVLFFVCLAAGVVAYLRTPVDFFPDISFNETIVETVWMGASAEEVERLVTNKIEDEVESITGLKEIQSSSSADFSAISISWDESLSKVEYESAINDLRAAIDRVGDLPSDAEEPYIRELSVAEVYAAIQIALTDEQGLGYSPLLEVARDIRDRVEDLPGVEKVIIRGEQDREVRVLVDRDAAARHALTVVEINDRIRRKNLNLPAGTFTGPAGEATLRAIGDYASVDEILETVIKENPNGTHVRLNEVARIEEGVEKRRYYARYNGYPALVMGIAKQKDAQLIAVAAEVREWVTEHADQIPAGLRIQTTWDTSRWVLDRMQVLRDNLLTGILVVLAVLWFTIGFRNSLLTVIAIPFSFLLALTLFPLFNLTINSFSLIGMLLVSGMLVDDAIIVLENIYRRIELGEPVREAVVKGTEEVLWPVVSAITTSCAAFFPLLLVTGTSGEFMSILPKTVIVCLIASLFECLVILPAHYLDWGSRRSERESLGTALAPATSRRAVMALLAAAGARLRTSIDRGLDALRARYLMALDLVLGNRGVFAVLTAALIALAVGLATHLPVNLFSSEYDNFFVVYETPSDFGLDQTDRVVGEIEREVLDALLGDPIFDYSTYVGSGLSGGRQGRSATNVALSYATIVSTPEYQVAPELALERVDAALRAYRDAHPELPLTDLRAMAPRNGPPIGKPVAVRIQGDDYIVTKGIAREMKEFLRATPGVSNIEDNLVDGPREVRLLVDEERASQHGLVFDDLARALRGANDGLVATSFRDPLEGSDLDIRVMLEPRFRRDTAGLLRAEVRTPAGYLVRLGDVASIEERRGFLTLSHFDATRAVTVYADVDGEQATSDGTNRALATEFADLAVRFPEVEVVFGGEAESERKAFADLRSVFPVALLLIYMILAAQFRSYAQPLIVITAIPFALIGVVLGVWILGYQMSFVMIYAAIGLAGVVVNDSIVMVDFINRARQGGEPVLEAVRQSGAIRLRPILLTTFTTVGALMPMALGIGGASKSYGPFAASIAFGLLVAMFGTLFMVPLSYTALVVNQERLRRLRSRLFGSGMIPATGHPPAGHEPGAMPK